MASARGNEMGNRAGKMKARNPEIMARMYAYFGGLVYIVLLDLD